VIIGHNRLLLMFEEILSYDIIVNDLTAGWNAFNSHSRQTVQPGWFDGALSRALPSAVYVWAAHVVMFHLVAGALQFLDYFKLLQQFKTHHDPNTKYSVCLAYALRNQICVMLPCMILSEYLGICFYPTGFHISLPLLVVGALCMTLGHDILFYLCHRFILHSEWGFHAFGHKLHHQSKASCAVSAMYMTSTDFFFEIVIPYLVPLWFVSPFTGFAVHVFFPMAGAFGGAYEHSGYNFLAGFKPLDTTAHTMHHMRYDCSFSDGVGSSNLMDSVFATTYGDFGHKTLLSVMPDKKHDQ